MRLGAHETPADVAAYMAEQGLGAWLLHNELGALRVLDPACGRGALLRAALDVLRDRYRGVGGVVPSDAAIAERHLFGIDIDPHAVEQSYVPAATLRIADALREAPFGQTRFGVVLGNPPYVFCPEQVEGELDASHEAQPDLYRLFYERSVCEHLAAGGVHVFLIPDAVLARDACASFRRWLVGALGLTRICHVGAVFPDLGVSSVVITGREGEETGQVEVDPWAGCDGGFGAAELSSDGRAWSLHEPPGWRAIREVMEGGRRLADILLDGAAGATRGEELGKRSLLIDGTGSPIYVGADVSRFRVGPPSRRLDPALLRKANAAYLGPKVLFVKTGAGPVAAVARDDIPVLQSLYCLHLRKEARIDPSAVVGLLCSALVTAYVFYTWTAQKKLQPQLTLGNVRSLPVGDADPAELLSIGELARRLEAGRGGGLVEVERRLDELVAAYFGLDLEATLPVFWPALQALPASQRPRWL